MENNNLYDLQKALEAFWTDNGTASAVNGRHTTVEVKPKFIVGNRVNPEVAKRILGVYLSQLTSDKIVNEDIVITDNAVRMYEEGKMIMEVINHGFVDGMKNEVTSKLGEELSKKTKKSGGNYLEHKEQGSYTYGQIKQALVDFMLDMGKNDSKNMLKDAILLIVK
jgi:hypothetical protein